MNLHFLSVFFLSLLASVSGAFHSLPQTVSATTSPAVAVATASGPLSTDTSGHPLRIPIIIYHTIAAGTPKETAAQGVFSTDPALLEQQLTFLDTHGYTTVTMQEVADMLRRGTTSPYVKPVALTFDDGWVTQYKNALPLLDKHHVKATFYIYPNPIGRDARFMTWEQLATIRDKGYEIAGHSYTHPLLSKLTPKELHHELYDSKTMLESKLGIKVTDFASPFGYTSPAVVAELKSDGYETGRTTNEGMTHTISSIYALDAYLVHKGEKDFEYALLVAK